MARPNTFMGDQHYLWNYGPVPVYLHVVWLCGNFRVSERS